MDEQPACHDESIKLVLKSTKDKSSMGKSLLEFQSDDESSSTPSSNFAEQFERIFSLKIRSTR